MPPTRCRAIASVKRRTASSDSVWPQLGEQDRELIAADPVCVNLQSPTLRLFAQNSGSPLSSLAVSVQFTDVLGQQLTMPVALIHSGSDWQPTTHVGPGGDWTIDDVYLDPFKTS